VKVLYNRAVLGECVMGGETVHGYFPAVVAQSEFDAARRAISAKSKGGNYIGGNCQRSTEAENLLSGLVFDMGFGEGSVTRAMHFQKVRKVHKYLTSAFGQGMVTNRVRYEVIESAILRHLTAEDWKAVAGESESPEVKVAKAVSAAKRTLRSPRCLHASSQATKRLYLP